MRNLLALLVFFLTLLPPAGLAAIPPSDSARPSSQSLRAQHAELRERLASSAFGKPLVLTTSEDRNRVTGEAHAVLNHPYAQAAAALADPGQWCEILMLPFNTKHCESAGSGGKAVSIQVHVGRKHTTPLENTHRLDFEFRTPSRTADYLRVELLAPSGPLGTRDYKIIFELAPLDERQSLLHFSYSYAYGALARAAMQAYLSTVGANKVGFTTEGTSQGGEPALVRGMPAVMERNSMRYYLAIESYLRSRSAPQEKRTQKMVEDWFAAVNRYPRQLHEMEREAYVAMKVKEYERMHAALSPARRTASSSP